MDRFWEVVGKITVACVLIAIGAKCQEAIEGKVKRLKLETENEILKTENELLRREKEYGMEREIESLKSKS